MATKTRTTAKTQENNHNSRSKTVRSASAPAPLATPTDLKPEAVEAITDALNGLVADAFALYVKTKNFHWHLAGSHFRDYHLLFDEQAAEISGKPIPLERLEALPYATTLVDE